MKAFFFLSIIGIWISKTQAQQIHVVSNPKVYVKSISKNAQLSMIEIEPASNIYYDLRYAGTQNFTQKKMYPASVQKSFLLLPAYKALMVALQQLTQMGYGIIIYDAYRPYQTTVAFWKLYQDERYVANPAKGSGHNRGLSIDLGLFDLRNKKIIDMGTGFDNFSDTAHHGFNQLPKEVLEKRLILKSTMEHAGFKALETEWWHYSYPNDMNAPVLNISFKKLGKLQEFNPRN